MGIIENAYLGFCRLTGGLIKSKASDELIDAVDFLKWDIDADKIVGAAKLAMMGIFLFLLIFAVYSFVTGMSLTIPVLLIPVSLVFFYLITEWPKSQAKQKAIEALGYSPQIIAQLAVPLKQKPNIEAAMSFVSKHGEGEIAKDFRKVTWEMWAGKIKNPFTGLEKISNKWGLYSNGFRRSMNLIEATFHESNKKRRDESIDKSIDVILDDIVSKMNDYAHGMHMPTLLLFSLGIIVPLMIISLFPIVAFFGIDIPPSMIAAFLFFSLAATYLYSEFVLRKRPPTFSAHDIKGDVPDGYIKFGALLPAKELAVIVAVVLSVPGILFIFGSGIESTTEGLSGLLLSVSTLSIIWGIGLALAIYYYGQSSHKKSKREKIKEMEVQFMDFMYHVKNRLRDGRPLEDAFDFGTKMMSNLSISDFLNRILNRMKRRSLPLEEAIKEEKIESPLINSVFVLLLTSLKKGTKAAAQTADVIVEYLTKIQSVEKELQRSLSKNLSMMRATAMFFAPIVCAIIVVLFQLITQSIASTQEEFGTFGAQQFAGGLIIEAPTISSEILQLIVGFYAIGLTFVLIRYISRVEKGYDKVAMGLDMAKALPIMLLVFTVSLIIARASLLSGSLF